MLENKSISEGERKNLLEVERELLEIEIGEEKNDQVRSHDFPDYHLISIRRAMKKFFGIAREFFRIGSMLFADCGKGYVPTRRSLFSPPERKKQHAHHDEQVCRLHSLPPTPPFAL